MARPAEHKFMRIKGIDADTRKVTGKTSSKPKLDYHGPRWRCETQDWR